MHYLLDTNACVVFLRQGGQSPVAQKLAAQDSSSVSLCAIVKQELLYGALHSERREENLALLRKFMSGFASYPFDDAAAEIAGKLQEELAVQGTPIGPYDLQIAAVALANDLTLVTHNTREFQRVSRLRVEAGSGQPQVVDESSSPNSSR